MKDKNPLREIEREIVSAVIFSSNNKIPFGKKDPSKGGVYADCWHLPGGGLDDGEDLIDGLIREVKEETGLEISRGQIELLDNEGRGRTNKTLKTGEEVIANMKFNVYRVQLDQNDGVIELTPNDDLVEFKSINEDELEDIKLTPPSVELFTRISPFAQ